MPEEFYDIEFPALRKHGWLRTSEPDVYNCIAFAAGDTARYWWPNPYIPDPSDDYWPPGAPQEETIDAFVQALATVGFKECANSDLEDGYQKVALYALNNVPTHAAVQQDNGKWRSKLGPHEDVETTLEGLVGPTCGDVVRYLKKERPKS